MAFSQVINENEKNIVSSANKQLKDTPKKVYLQGSSIDYINYNEPYTLGFDRKLFSEISIETGSENILTDMNSHDKSEEDYKKADLELAKDDFSMISPIEAEINESPKNLNRIVDGVPAYLNGYVYTSPTQSYYRNK